MILLGEIVVFRLPKVRYFHLHLQRKDVDFFVDFDDIFPNEKRSFHMLALSYCDRDLNALR